MLFPVDEINPAIEAELVTIQFTPNVRIRKKEEKKKENE